MCQVLWTNLVLIERPFSSLRMPQVCQYERQEQVRLQVPTTRAFTATVKIQRPGCYSNTQDCVDYERRTKYRTVYQEREEVHTHKIFACCPGWAVQDAMERDEKKGGKRHKGEETSDGGSGGCSVRVETSPENGGREITHEGHVYHLVDGSQEKKNNSYFKGELYHLYKLVYGPVEGEQSLGNESTEAVSFLPYSQPHQEAQGNKSIKTFDYASDDPASQDYNRAGDLVLPPSSQQSSPSGSKDDVPDEVSTNSRRHRAHHHKRPSTSHTPTAGHRHHRSRNNLNRHHYRRHRSRSAAGREEGVENNTTYTPGKNSRRPYHKVYRNKNKNDTEFDAYSYTIILAPRKRGERRRGGAPSERPGGVAAQEQVAQLQEVVVTPPGVPHTLLQLRWNLGVRKYRTSNKPES